MMYGLDVMSVTTNLALGMTLTHSGSNPHNVAIEEAIEVHVNQEGEMQEVNSLKH